MSTNKHGLTRSSLDAETKRQIRQNSGFGCVICGNAIGEYDHVDPEFANAKVHDPNKMTFLCYQHHGKVTKKQLSRETVKAAMANPHALSSGFSFEAFDLGNAPPTIHFGAMSAKGCQYLIRVEGKPVFWIRSPKNAGEPFLLNAEFRNALGEVMLRIIDNEWQVRKENWDVDVVSNRITIRAALRRINLILRTEPPNDIFIDQMDMETGFGRIICDKNRFRILRPTGEEVINASSLLLMSHVSAVDIDSRGVGVGVGGGITMISGRIGDSTPSVSKLPDMKNYDQMYSQKVPRNASCPCGSKIKYKKCCGRMTP